MSLTTLYETDEVESIIAPQKPEKRSSVDSTTSTTSTSSWRSSSSSSSRMKRLSARFSGLFLFGSSRRSSMQSMAPPPAAVRRSSSSPVLSGRMSDETLRATPAVTPAFLAGLANFDYDSFGPTPHKAGKWRAQDQWRPEDLQGNYAIM
ncbi:hypothetical protein FIBSPDRAFT_923732 [Athelia psychrophila]|uniref:Uncharacterized protein n=1 Tax=Athelia psychrophila TaxID=1759441 RepID=A0A166WW96_9AGAM|nr:hypothetical protein FIBSPDRAFT_923732 [Fibularhizoctonia sp. CBS 109695]